MISVIIPYKNAARWIRRCADSLTTQEGDFQFIFVNDSSEDEGPEILTEYKDDRFVLLYNSDYSGVSGARNEGLNNAEGDWITFLDADDQMLSGAWDKFQKMLETDADIHQANHLRYIAKRKAFRHKWTNPDGMYEIPAMPEMWAPVWNKLFRAELIQDIRFDPALWFGEDEIFSLQAVARAKRIHNSAVDVIQHNLENPESLSHRKTDINLADLMVALEILLTQQDDPAMRTVIYNTMLTHLQTEWFRKVMCTK